MTPRTNGVEEETFDLDGISGSEEEEEEVSVPRARGRFDTNAGRSALNTAASDPLMTQTSQTRQSTSADIHFFFTKRKGEDTVCNVCRYVTYSLFCKSWP